MMTRGDGAVYLCGYAVELALKNRICLTLNWLDFPESAKEFSGLASLKTHDLPTLLKFTGVEASVGSMPEWLAVLDWSPEDRYKPVGSATLASAQLMLNSTRAILGAL
jgi:hypothetical protein